MIIWRKWNVNDFYLFDKNKSCLPLLPLLQQKNLQVFFETIVSENKYEKLKRIDTTLLSGFTRNNLLNLKNADDINQSDNSKLKQMLNVSSVLVLPAPLVYINNNNKLILLDGNHRSAFAKIMNIEIKAQILKPTNTIENLKKVARTYHTLKKFINYDQQNISNS